MKVTELAVEASLTTPNPNMAYANVKPSVRVSATIEDGDDLLRCLDALMEVAHRAVLLQSQKLMEAQCNGSVGSALR